MNDFFAFQWHILDDCDQRCKHCYIFQDESELQTMNPDDMELVLDNCIRMCERTNRKPYFSITGGDPILHPNFWNLVERLHELNIDYGLMGNPFHLTDKVCERLKSLGCRQYQMSLDGLRKTHDWFRKNGSYDLTLKKIRQLKNAGIKTAIMTTVSRKNMGQIPWIIDEVVRNKVDVFSFARYCPGDDKSDAMTPHEYKNLLDKVWNKFSQYRYSDTLFTLKDHLWTLFLYEKNIFKIPQNLKDDVIYDGCNCANNHLTILPNGDVYACRRMESKVGNAVFDDLFELFKSEKMDEFRQYENFEKCSSCELLRFCRGCPAVSYSYTEDMYSPDPQCWR